MTLLPNWLTRCAENYPTKLAVRCGSTDWTFAELEGHTIRTAQHLATTGVNEGDRVALLAVNGLPFVAAVHALTRLGAVLIPLNSRLTVAELCWQLTDARADLLLCDEHWAEMAELIGESLPSLPRIVINAALFAGDETTNPYPPASIILHDEIDLDAMQAIIYTSGTTGQPKGACITYGMQWWSAVGSALNLGHDPADRWLACLPFFHIGGLSMLFRGVINGIGIVVHERFDAAAIHQSINKDGVTIISVVAVMAQRMLAELGEARYPAAFRCLLLGGGPAPQPLLEACARRHIPVVQTYGMTETCAQAVTLAPADALRKLGSAGRPLASVQLRIMHEAHEAAANEAGEIQVRGPTITPGYVDRPELTASAFQDGWFATGDLGYLDAEGYLYVLDRRTDLIISGGENVYPAEIEATLLAHPDVLEAGVCGQPDADWGQVPIAFVQLRIGSTTTAEDLRTFAAQHLARYKVPQAVHVVDALPRNASGKLLRRELRGLLEQGKE